MSTDVTWVTPETTVSEAARLMQRGNFGSLPVGDKDRLVGMVTDRDIVTRCLAGGGNPGKTKVGEVMSKGMLYCRDDQTTEEVSRNMGDIQVRRLAVVDNNKRMVGIVSLGDIATHNSHEMSGDTLEHICFASPDSRALHH